MSLISRKAILVVALAATAAATDRRTFTFTPPGFQKGEGPSLEVSVDIDVDNGRLLNVIGPNLRTPADAAIAVLETALSANYHDSVDEILSIWSPEERAATRLVLQDEAKRAKNATLFHSFQEFRLLARLHYGKFVVFLTAERYLNGEWRAAFYPFKREGPALYMTNDLRTDPLIFMVAAEVGKQQLYDLLRAKPELGIRDKK